jgi:myo-inositol-1-phosphate synthase
MDDESDPNYELARRPWSGELNVNPWDAILGEVRRSAYRAAWIDERIDLEIRRERSLIDSDGVDFDKATDFEIAVRIRSGELREWIKESRDERKHLTKVAADAVRAGLIERYIDSLRAEAQMIAQALTKALDAAELTPMQRSRASDALREALADMGPMLAARQESMAGTVAVRPEIGR